MKTIFVEAKYIPIIPKEIRKRGDKGKGGDKEAAANRLTGKGIVNKGVVDKRAVDKEVIGKETIARLSRLREKLPGRVGLVSSIQFIDFLPIIQKELAQSKKPKELKESEQSNGLENKKNSKKNSKKNKNRSVLIGGQVLGCNLKNAERIIKRVDAFLYIGDGDFHPIGIAVRAKKEVFTFNPVNDVFKKLEREKIENYEKRRKTALIKFLSAENIGVLVSTKPGQYYGLKRLASLEKRLERKYCGYCGKTYRNRKEWNKRSSKRFYTFIADTLDYSELGNFPFIEAWVNTSCPRIEDDITALNIREICRQNC